MPLYQHSSSSVQPVHRRRAGAVDVRLGWGFCASVHATLSCTPPNGGGHVRAWDALHCSGLLRHVACGRAAAGRDPSARPARHALPWSSTSCLRPTQRMLREASRVARLCRIMVQRPGAATSLRCPTAQTTAHLLMPTSRAEPLNPRGRRRTTLLLTQQGSTPKHSRSRAWLVWSCDHEKDRARDPERLERTPSWAQQVILPGPARKQP